MMGSEDPEGPEGEGRGNPAPLFSASHPVRATAMRMMDRAPTSPKEVAEAVGKPIGNVTHHIRVLVRAGLVELVETRKVRGATEHFYRSTAGVAISDEESAKLSIAERRVQSTLTLHLIISDAARALEADTLDARPDRHLTRIPLILDQRGWEGIRDLFQRSLDEALTLEQESVERLKESGEEGFTALGAWMLFGMPDSVEEEAERRD